MSNIFKYKFVVPPDSIDEQGHVNNVEYVRWMQEIAIMHSDEVGCTRELYERVGGTWVIKSHRIDYKNPAFEGDEIEAFTWVSNMKRISSLRKYKFTRIKDGKVLATAETDWVFYNTNTNRPCRIDETVKNSFPVVSEDDEP